ncbi:DUF4136 domain-containing protein [Massilia sp. Dwa41.01b]|uniref:DUF4136 domain-containing protein n=1 Tax=unclassified Massilia TaxID=2609279 RepID=UPI001600E5B7|nr:MULTISPECIES: DUF4136 domain-containing protein [unclassified Massilia]QNA90290.1 DUF4136 domain-containing protein [Massilia sp. Dwa41.01b]QNB01190.1 DUF4136 domain-containing protein [Massilia sp. Se16.2.3]
MKRLIMLTAAAAMALLLGGCATTIRSDVTTFHQWPAQIEDKSYVFEAPPAIDNTLEYQSYQNLVRGQLAQLGFREANTGGAALKVAMRFTTTDVPVRVIEPTTPLFEPYPMYYRYGPRFGPRGRWARWHHPFYDPFWNPFPSYQVSVEHQYRRELQVSIKDKADKRLFDVTVHNTSRELSTPALMPALVHSAFAGFPGPNGVARRVELQQKRG